MRVRVRYLKEVALAALGDNSCHFEVEHEALGNTRCTRRTLDRLGVATEDLNTAELFPGDWVNCPREEQLPSGVRTKSEAIADLTKQRDALLKACKSAVEVIILERLGQPSDGIELPAWMWVAIRDAVALAEPKA